MRWHIGILASPVIMAHTQIQNMPVLGACTEGTRFICMNVICRPRFTTD